MSRPGLKGQGEGGARFGSGSVGDGGVASLQPQPTCALAESVLGNSYSDHFLLLRSCHLPSLSLVVPAKGLASQHLGRGERAESRSGTGTGEYPTHLG